MKCFERNPMKETENHYIVAAEKAQKRNRERKIVRRVYSALSVLVAVLMFYYLMKPPITLEAHPGDGNPQLICGMEEHVHTEACWGYDHEAYEPVYVNSLALNCPFVPHVHDGKCFDADGNLICGISEE